MPRKPRLLGGVKGKNNKETSFAHILFATGVPGKPHPMGATVVIVDTNDEKTYKMKHIKGAIHFPWAKVIGDPGSLPKDKLMVLYCGCIGEEASDNVAQQLMNDWGYTNIKVLDGGLMRWSKLGYPVEMG